MLILGCSWHGRAYDAFRENFLHARPNLATCLPLSPGKLTWVDVGAGTARNLEFFSVETLRRRFSKIYVLDISASLLFVENWSQLDSN